MTQPPPTKEESLVQYLGMLAEGYSQPLTTTQLKVYVMVLNDLSLEQLNHGCNRAIRELTFWPRPAELRELCSGIKAKKSDSTRADAAWEWVITYLEYYGIDGETQYELQGRTEYMFKDGKIEAEYYHRLQILNGAWGPLDQFATSAPFYILTSREAPEIPDLVSSTLIQLAGSVKGGLKRISKARSDADPSERNGVDSTKEITFLRKDFTEHYLNAIVRDSETTPQVISSSSRLLPGNAKPEFPVFSVYRLAIRLLPDDGPMGLRYEVIALEAATQAHNEGKLDNEAYQNTLLYWESKRLEKEKESVPVDYWAICIPRSEKYQYDPSTGLFKIETFDGSRIVLPRKVFALAGRVFNEGDRVHIRIMPGLLEKQLSILDIAVTEPEG
jgi:hypothetical protein